MKNIIKKPAELKDNMVYELPGSYREEFVRSYFFVNLARLKFFSVLVLIILSILIFTEASGRFLFATEEGRLMLLKNHSIFAAGMLVFFLITMLFPPKSPDSIRAGHKIACLAAVVFILIMSVMLSMSYPYGVLSLYVIACLGVASVFYFHPATTLLIYAMSHTVFIIGQSQVQDNQFLLNTYYVNGTAAVILAWGISVAVYNTRAHDFINRKTIERLLEQDGLTGLANRRQFDSVLQREWLRALRNSMPISLILVDMDFFEAYNKTYGHLKGDDCLKLVANAVAGSLKRPGDLAARFDGDELAVILPETDRNGAAVIAEKIRGQVEDLKMPNSSSAACEYITLSVGVSTFIPIPNTSPQLLISLTEQALFGAKESGGNRISIIG